MWKVVSLLASGKYKLKPWQDSTPYLLEWLKYKILTVPSACEDVEQQEASCLLCWWKCKMVQILWGKVLTWNYHMAQQSYAEAYTQENWKHVFTQKPCVFIAALFTIAKCPPMEKWINHTWHVHAMEHCVQSRKGM